VMEEAVPIRQPSLFADDIPALAAASTRQRRRRHTPDVDELRHALADALAEVKQLRQQLAESEATAERRVARARTEALAMAQRQIEAMEREMDALREEAARGRGKGDDTLATPPAPRRRRG
jgi:chromosome segregation ATPase